MTWIVEPQVFPNSYEAFCQAIEQSGDHLIRWDDHWWFSGQFPKVAEGPLLFHGSLNNAHRIKTELPWTPGAFCATNRFSCSSWYPRASPWLVQVDFVFTSVQELVDAPDTVAGHLAKEGEVFVRPDGPLKPFAGRVCKLADLTLQTLDYGFYYDDPNTPVLVARPRQIGHEWRFVVVNRQVVCGCSYEASGRNAIQSTQDVPFDTAATIADKFEPPENVYVLDLCEADGSTQLLELNPFSGANLYHCDPAAIVSSIRRHLLEP